MIKAIEDKAQDDWWLTVTRYKRLKIFRVVWNTNEKCSLMAEALPREFRSILWDLLLGTLPLHRETGKWRNTPIDRRYCHCKQDIEDLNHFVFYCHRYQDLREKYCPRMGLPARFHGIPFLRTPGVQQKEELRRMINKPFIFGAYVTKLWERRTRIIETETKKTSELRQDLENLDRTYWNMQQ